MEQATETSPATRFDARLWGLLLLLCGVLFLDGMDVSMVAVVASRRSCSQVPSTMIRPGEPSLRRASSSRTRGCCAPIGRAEGCTVMCKLRKERINKRAGDRTVRSGVATPQHVSESAAYRARRSRTPCRGAVVLTRPSRPRQPRILITYRMVGSRRSAVIRFSTGARRASFGLSVRRG